MEALPLIVRLLLGAVLWVAGFVVLWRLVVWFLSKLARWAELKELYATKEKYAGLLWRSASGHLGPVWYASTLSLGSSTVGLYIAPQFPFHFGAAPVLIPWSDIEVSRRSRIFTTMTHFSFVRVPGLALKVSGKGADWILQAAGLPSGIASSDSRS